MELSPIFTRPALVAILAVISPATMAACLTNVPAQPATRFQVAQGLVTDTLTGLMWQQCSVGQTYADGTCTNAANLVTWYTASSQALAAIDFGFADWRLPNRKELESIVDFACINPALNSTVFPATPSARYWSSSPYLTSNGFAWSVSFHDGQVFAQNGSETAAVRLVRTL